MKKLRYATVIEPSGESREVSPANGREFTLEELHAFVGGYIELVKLKPGNGQDYMYINEEGKLQHLAPNPRATALAAIDPRDVIAGTAVIMRRY